MPGSLDLVVEFPASVEQVHSAFRDEHYWVARLAAFGGSTTLDSLILHADSAVTVVTTQDLRRQALPRMVAKVFPPDLKILRKETWKPIGGRRVSGDVTVSAPGALGSGRADALLAPMHDGSRLRFTAIMEVKVPLVGGKIESYIGGQLAEQLHVMQRFTTAWLTQK
ncbi:MAG: DUF2505 domain-containing protein [Candidatus Sericytochromatia bacterium]